MRNRALFAIGLAVLTSACGAATPPLAPPPKRKAPATALVEELVMPKELSFSGTVVAARDALLASSRGGRVEAHVAEVGAHVRRGQVVARLGQGELVFATEIAAAGAKQAEARLGDERAPERAPSVLAAKANLDSAEDAATRAEALFAQGSSSAQDLVRAKNTHAAAKADYSVALAQARADLARVREMRATLGQANAALDDRDLRVPFDGVVLQRFVEVGRMAPPHAPVVRVIDPTELHVRFDVAQAEADRVPLGAKTRIVVGGKPVAGAIFRASPGLVGEATTRIVDARLEAPTDGVLPGMHTTIWVALPETETVFPIPASATTSNAGVVRAWVLVENRLSPRLLSVARYEGDRVFVRSGLRRGEALVTDPSPDFRVDEEVAP